MGIELKISRPTIFVAWVLSAGLFLILALGSLGFIQIGKVLGYPIGVGSVLLLGAVILMAEVLGHSDRPTIEELVKFESMGDSVSIVLALLLLVAGGMTLGNMAIPHWLSTLLPFAYILTFIAIVREGFY